MANTRSRTREIQHPKQVCSRPPLSFDAKSKKIQHRGSAEGGGAQVRTLGKALSTSGQERPAVSRRRLVIADSFEVPPLRLGASATAIYPISVRFIFG
jgi:hypothetical protein